MKHVFDFAFKLIVLKWFYDTFIGVAIEVVRYVSFMWKVFSLLLVSSR
jgi:hypothetical protein